MVSALKTVLTTLLDRCVHLPLTIDYLNNSAFAPKQGMDAIRVAA
jgi:hypothetical protein